MLFIIVAIALIADVITGTIGMASSPTGTTAISGCNNPSSLEQCGTGVCHEMNHSFCIITTTFATPFASTPKSVTGVINGITTDASGTVSFPLEYFSSTGTIVFQSDNGETWVNMPAALTEIYGNTNHENLLSAINSLGVTPTGAEAEIKASVTVGCLTGSASATAYVKPQYLSSSTGLWTDLAAGAGALNVAIDSTTCSFSASPVQSSLGLAFVDSGYTLANAPISPLRIVGVNGNGIGDNVVLNNIQIQFYQTYFATFTICTPFNFVCPNVTTMDSKTKIYFEVDWNTEAGGLSAYPWIWVQWQATQ